MQFQSHNKQKKWHWAASAGLMTAFFGFSPLLLEARVVTVRQPVRAPVYSTQNYYPGSTVVEPLLLPRTGSNDYLYTYDNVYGAGASAAGRMDRVVTNPQPQLYYPRQQPRVYLGY